MNYRHSLEEASEYANLAMLIMADQQIPPHPNNYAIWFNYFSGAFPELRRTLDRLLNGQKQLTEESNDQVYRRFCSDGYDDRPLHLAAKKMETELGTLLDVVERAERGAADYHKTLQTASGEIGSAEDASSFRDMISRLLSETRLMADHSRQLERKLNQSASRISQLTEELEAARREAVTDGMTGVANRKLFDTILRQAAMDAMENAEPLSLLFMDVDHFKKFNDTFGHQVGDLVLKLLATLLQKNIRSDDTAARYGGEEFAVVLPQTDLDSAVAIAETIRRDVANKALIQRNSREKLSRITVSVGVATLAVGEPLRRLIERADQALYAAKRRGRNNVVSERHLTDHGLKLVK